MEPAVSIFFTLSLFLFYSKNIQQKKKVLLLSRFVLIRAESWMIWLDDGGQLIRLRFLWVDVKIRRQERGGSSLTVAITTALQLCTLMHVHLFMYIRRRLICLLAAVVFIGAPLTTHFCWWPKPIAAGNNATLHGWLFLYINISIANNELVLVS